LLFLLSWSKRLRVQRGLMRSGERSHVDVGGLHPEHLLFDALGVRVQGGKLGLEHLGRVAAGQLASDWLD